MTINDGFEKLVKLPEIYNDTELSLDELNEIDWEEVGTEQANYSIMTATSYVNSDLTIVKKVFSDGYTEYYYTCQ
jgi:hypothetical protein